jgi:hypothetical protein
MNKWETITDRHGVTWEPWTDGWAVGFKVTAPDGRVEHVYLNPSSESDDGVSTVFLYHKTKEAQSVVYVDVFKESHTTCDECGAVIPDITGGGLANKHHEPSCSLFEEGRP